MSKTQNTWAITAADRKAILDSIKAVESASTNVTFLQAVSADLAITVHESVGEGRLYETQGDYAKRIGTSQTNVSRLKTLGLAIRTLGLTAEHPAFKVIAARASVKAVADVIRSDKGTVAKVATAARKAEAAARQQTADKAAEKNKKQSREPRPNSGEGAADLPVAEVAPVADMSVAALVKALGDALKGADEATLARVEKSVGGFITRERTLLAKAVKAEATA